MAWAHPFLWNCHELPIENQKKVEGIFIRFDLYKSWPFWISFDMSWIVKHLTTHDLIVFSCLGTHGEFRKCWRAHGYSASSYDIKLNTDHDICTERGFFQLLQLGCRQLCLARMLLFAQLCLFLWMFWTVFSNAFHIFHLSTTFEYFRYVFNIIYLEYIWIYVIYNIWICLFHAG